MTARGSVFDRLMRDECICGRNQTDALGLFRHGSSLGRLVRPVVTTLIMIASVDSSRSENIALFYDSAYVDSATPSISSEPYNMKLALQAFGHTVTTFSGITDTSFSAALASANVLVIPEMEVGNLAAALSPSAKGVISNYVAGGGRMIINGTTSGNAASLVNTVFGFSVSLGLTSGSTYYFDPAASDTAFAGGSSSIPWNNGTYTWTSTSLPAGSIRVYTNGSYTAVACKSFNLGAITFLAYDWYNAVPNGSQDGGWNDVLRRAVTNKPYAAVPSFTATPNPAACGQVISFDGSASTHTDPSRSIVNYQWTFGDGGTASGATTMHAYNQFGTFTATLTVMDNGSPPQSATASVLVNVNQGNLAPTAASGGPYIVVNGNNVTLNGSGSTDPNLGCGDTLTYQWDLMNDGSYNAAGASPTLTWAQLQAAGITGSGTYSVKLLVTDSFGVSSVSTTTLTVLTPTISASSDQLAFPGTAVNTVSAEQSYSVSGTELVGNLTVTAPMGLQVSLTSGSGFGSTVMLTPSGGAVPATTIYVRFAPTAGGAFSGSLTHASTSATTKYKGVIGAGLSATPQIISYQGKISVGGANFHGTGQFRFALVNADGTATYWSSGASAVSLSVSKGLYAVLLGDTTIPNMAAIPSSVFDNSDVRLRVWFNDGVNGEELLTPDQRVASAGYAINAARVNGASGGTVADAMISVMTATSTNTPGTLVKRDVSGNLAAGTVTGSGFVGNGAGITGLIPAGLTYPYMGTTAPSGWLLCDGSAVSRTTYAALFSVIGTACGSGDGSTTFNLPDMRGMFVRGVNGARGSAGDPDAASRAAQAAGGNAGNNVGSVQDKATAMPNSTFATASAGSHSHTYGDYFWRDTDTSPADDYGVPDGDDVGERPSVTRTSDPAGAHTHAIAGGDSETRPRNIYVNYIIRY